MLMLESVPAPSSLSTSRVRLHLDKLAQSEGKRIVIDLPAEDRMALDHLISRGYGSNQSDVVRKALRQVVQQSRLSEQPMIIIRRKCEGIGPFAAEQIATRMNQICGC
jgi:Arc/MetJ-type ribon-helix-helix transcriptional regulator